MLSLMVATPLSSRRDKNRMIQKMATISLMILTTSRRRRKFSQLIAKDLLQHGLHARSHAAPERGQGSSQSRRSPMVAMPALLMRQKTAMSKNAQSIAEGTLQSGRSAQSHAVAERKQGSMLFRNQRPTVEQLAQLPRLENAMSSLAPLIAKAPGVGSALARNHVVVDNNLALTLSPLRPRTAVMLAHHLCRNHKPATPMSAL